MLIYLQALSMLYTSKRYNAVAVYDRGLLSDIFGLNSFQEDISKCMASIAVIPIQVLSFKFLIYLSYAIILNYKCHAFSKL